MEAANQTFKVGDKIWVYDWMYGLVPCVVIEPYLCAYDGDLYDISYNISFSESGIGKNVFATQEEGEREVVMSRQEELAQFYNQPENKKIRVIFGRDLSLLEKIIVWIVKKWVRHLKYNDMRFRRFNLDRCVYREMYFWDC